MSRRTLAALATALLAMLILAAPAPADASTIPPPKPIPPVWLPTCATGAFTQVNAPDLTIFLGGWILPCNPADLSTGRWAIIAYSATSGSASPEHYPANVAGHLNESIKYTPAASSAYQIRAFCLAYGSYNRLSCYSITLTPDGQHLSVLAIPITDPLVAALPVQLTDPGDPNCATCV